MMPLQTGRIVFLCLAAISLGAALRTVTARRLVSATLCLGITGVAIAGLLLLFAAPWMAGVQLFVATGGVVALLITEITAKEAAPESPRRSVQPGAAALIAGGLFGVLVWMIQQVPLLGTPNGPVIADGTAQLGAALTDPLRHLLTFQAVGLLLLVTLLGGVYLGRGR